MREASRCVYMKETSTAYYYGQSHNHNGIRDSEQTQQE